MLVCCLMTIYSDSLEELDQRERFRGYIPSLVLSKFVLRKCVELRFFYLLIFDLQFAHAFSHFGI